MDPCSKQLLILKETEPEAAEKISSILLEWKNNFSLNWYYQYIHEEQKNLDFVFTLLFQLAEFSNPQVTITAFNAIGALLVSLSPFFSSELIQSFKTTLSALSVSPNTSCAAISTFVFLSHQVADIKVNQFIETIPIMSHFGADLRDFISRIPNLIEQMDRLSLGFHQALLRSLISSFGRSPSDPFIESVLLLLQRFPERLTSDLMEFIESNKLDATLISIGGRLLRNEKLSKCLTVEQKSKFLEIVKAKVLINDEELTIQQEIATTELEQSVSILTGMRIQPEENLKEEADKISQLILKNKSKYKSLLQRVLIPLITQFADLDFNENDSTNVMSIKLLALKNIQDITDEQILKICEPFIERRDEVFITVIRFFAVYMKEKAYRLIEKVFKNSDYSWIQKSAILTLIDHLDQFKMSDLIPNYNKICINFLISCSLSPQMELSQQSREVVGRFVSINNVECFRTAILNCDFFDPQMTKHILMLLNSIVNNISPYPLQCFIGIVVELLISVESGASDFNENSNSSSGNLNDDRSKAPNLLAPSFVTDCFEFLSHFLTKLPYLPSIENICLKKMQEMYYSFTLKKLFFAPDDKNLSNIPLNRVRPLLSTITTDVVAHASLVQYEFLKPLRNCLQYIRALPAKKPIHYQILIRLLSLFPADILPELSVNLLSDDFKRAMSQIQRIFNSNRDQAVIAKCCEFFIKTKTVTQSIVNEVQCILKNTVIKSSSSAFTFLKIIYQQQPELAKEILKDLLRLDGKSPLPVLLRNELAVCLFEIDDLLLLFKNLSEYSFLQYKTSRYLAKQWFETQDYCEWPLSDPTLTTEISNMFESNGSIHIKDCSKLDEKHWSFILKHRKIFCESDYSDYIMSHRISMMKMCAFMMKDDHDEHFILNKNLNLNPIESLIPSASLLLKRNKIVSNEALIKNFLMFSQIRLDAPLVNQIEKRFPKFQPLINEYRHRNELTQTVNQIQNEEKNQQVQVTENNETNNDVNPIQNDIDNSVKESIPESQVDVIPIPIDKNDEIIEEEYDESDENSDVQQQNQMTPESNNSTNEIRSNNTEQSANENITQTEINMDNENQAIHSDSVNNETTTENPLHDENGEIQLRQPNASNQLNINNQETTTETAKQNQIDSDLIKYDDNFPIKKRYLKKLCQSKFQSILDISLIRMRLFLKLDSITSPRKLFYFLRFLRVTSSLIENENDRKPIIQNTIENFHLLTSKLKKLVINHGNDAFIGQTDYSYLVLEYMKLALLIISAEDIPYHCQPLIVPHIIESIDYLNLSNLMSQCIKLAKSTSPNASNVVLETNSLMKIKSDHFITVPSFMLYILHYIQSVPLFEANQFVSTNFKELLRQKLVSDELIGFLSKSPEYLPAHFKKGVVSEKDYFNEALIAKIISIIIDSQSPLFTSAGRCHFFSVLFDRISGSKNQLEQFQSSIEKLPSCGYTSSFSMELVKSYYSTVESNLSNSKKSFEKDYGIKAIRTAQSVYLKYPSVLNALQLADVLIKGSGYFDSLALIFGKFVPIEDLGFLGTFCIAYKFYMYFYQNESKRDKFVISVNKFIKADNIKSRQVALEMIMKDAKSFDVAFALACLETNDDEKINEIIRLLS